MWKSRFILAAAAALTLIAPAHGQYVNSNDWRSRNYNWRENTPQEKRIQNDWRNNTWRDEQAQDNWRDNTWRGRPAKQVEGQDERKNNAKDKSKTNATDTTIDRGYGDCGVGLAGSSATPCR